MHFAGVDVGSTMTKTVIYNGEIMASVIGPTGAEHRRTANRVMQTVLEKAGLVLNDITYIVATGYGRINVPFADKQVTEISCHAKGVAAIFPTAKTIIDIGGQDSKGIKVINGKVMNFVMNDKCAAGTGRFLEVISDALGVKVEEIGPLSLQAGSLPRISNTCTVFAEQEVVSLLAAGTKVEDILAGIHDSIASRVHAMAQRLKIEKDVVVTGGGAKNVGLVRALERKMGCPVLVAEEPLLTGALGAALIGMELAHTARQKGLTIGRGDRRLEEVTFFDE